MIFKQLTDAFRTVWDVRSLYFKSLGIRCLVGGAVLIGFIAIVILASIWKENTSLKLGILLLGSGILIFFYLKYGWPIVVREQVLTLSNGMHTLFPPKETPHEKETAKDREQKKGEQPDGKRQLSLHFEAPEKLAEFVRLVRRTIRNIHRNLIDITSIFSWLRKLKVTRITTEFTHGTARFLEAAITARAINAPLYHCYDVTQKDILNYLSNWKELGGAAMRLIVVNVVGILVLSAFLFMTVYPILLKVTDNEAQLVSVIFIFFSARFLLQGIAEPVYAFYLISLLQTKSPSNDAMAIWHERILQVSRSYRSLSSHVQNETELQGKLKEREEGLEL